MPPKPKGSNAITPMRLPPLPQLRIRQARPSQSNPCLSVMSAMLGCWASTGHNLQACAGLEQQLRMCMDGPRSKERKTNTINYHLKRFGPLMSGPAKKGK